MVKTAQAKPKAPIIQSQKVKTLINMPIDERTIEWLQSQHYTNEELIEIITVSEQIKLNSTVMRTYFCRTAYPSPA